MDRRESDWINKAYGLIGRLIVRTQAYREEMLMGNDFAKAIDQLFDEAQEIHGSWRPSLPVESGADVRAERDRYRKALEFYADPDTYHNLAFVNTQRCPFWHDFGFKGTRFKKRSKGNRGAPGVKARAALIKREEGQNRE